MQNEPLIVMCDVQGVQYEELLYEEAIEWIEKEINFWHSLGGIDNDFSLFGQIVRNPEINISYNRKLNNIKADLINKNGDKFVKYIESSKKLKVLLSEGEYGIQIKNLVQNARTEIAQGLCLALSEDVINRWHEFSKMLAPIIICLRFNPLLIQNISLSSAQESKEISERSEQNIIKIQSKMANFIKEKTLELETLRNRYEIHLELAGPAQHWKSVAKTASIVAAISLVTFVLFILLSIMLIYSNWTAISSYIDHVIEMSNGGISLAPLIVFSIPLLASGWLLKHISRIFIQSLLTYSDAEHRQIMAKTFLGLAERNNVGISEAERAIVLNAMFRPGPSSPQDDGPPMGLLDLLGKK